MKASFLPVALLIATQSCFSAELPADKLISEIEGVYKYRHTTMEYNGGKPEIPHQVEDIIEIVRHNATHIYFRAELNFYNGHSCSIYGIAGYTGGKFSYHEQAQLGSNDGECGIEINKSDSHIQLTSGQSNCSFYCGVRGSLRDVQLANSSRRKIRYLPLLQSSRQYKAAVAEFDSRPKN